jgi:NADH-quinone oxidoreductase subunit L
MTAYYTFRMIFVVFYGSPRDQKAFDHAHESPAVMTVPLIILAVGAVLAGFLNLPAIFGGDSQISGWLAPSLADHHPHVGHSVELLAIFSSIVAFAVGITIAFKKFGKGAEEPIFSGFAKFGFNKFYVDELYNAIFVQPYKGFGGIISRILEPNVTDIHIKLSVWLYQKAGTAFKALQVGYVRVYAIYMVIGLSLMSLFLSQAIK